MTDYDLGMESGSNGKRERGEERKTVIDTSASTIASVVADLRAGRILPIKPRAEISTTKNLKMITEGPVVDATAIYKSIVASGRPIRIYEDHPCIAPPWPSAIVCYQNEHGNVIAMTSVSHDLSTDGPAPSSFRPWNTAEPIDWNMVRWVTVVLIWMGGYSPHVGWFPTSGPVHMWKFAIYDNGEPADLHWQQLLEEYRKENWDMAHLTILGTLNFMNCRNVELVEPHRPRAEARRITRTGVRVSTVNVFPTGRSSKSSKSSSDHGVPLSSVRGHFAKYGSEYGRGLLFGKYSGRFWIPQHARGSVEYGEVTTDYVLK